MKNLPALFVAIAAAFLFSSCANHYRKHGIGNGAAYWRYEPSVLQIARIRDAHQPADPLLVSATVSDADVVAYADHVRMILRQKFTTARNVRQGSATLQAILGLSAGAAALFDGGATAVAALAFGSTIVPRLGGTYDVEARALAYEQAVSLIAEAESAYYQAMAPASNIPPDDELTAPGATLLAATQASVAVVEKVQAGILPSLEELKVASGEGE